MPSGRDEWDAILSLFPGPRRGPRANDRSLRLVLPGAAVDNTYGTLGAMISLLIWLWLGNLAFLLGAMFNAEVQRIKGGGR